MRVGEWMELKMDKAGILKKNGNMRGCGSMGR